MSASLTAANGMDLLCSCPASRKSRMGLPTPGASHATSLEGCPKIGVDIGKNTFHLIGLAKVGAIVLCQKLSRNQVDIRLAICGVASSAWRHASGRIT